MNVLDELIEIIANMQDRIDQQEKDIDELAGIIHQLITEKRLTQ